MRRGVAPLTAMLFLAAWTAGCAGRGTPHRQAVGARLPEVAGPRTRPERTNYLETSTYADVVAFLDSLKAAGADIHVTSMGRTVEGREIPVVIASRPLVTTPQEAWELGRRIVYVQGNIHGGEVEGKEALQALLRDLTLGPKPNALDSIVLIAVPIYNADGNERFAPQAVHRSEQNGPEMVGARANAGGLDLNRDYIKGDAPETRASLALLEAWRPDVFVDLHTTNGSYHGYALTYSPTLNPAAPHGGWYARDRLLPELRRRAARRGVPTFDYGNFSLRNGIDAITDTTKQGWRTFDHRPRFGTNYFGLRGGIAVLVEGYSHDPFRRRIETTYVFVSELLSLVAEQAGEIHGITAHARDAHPLRDETQGSLRFHPDSVHPAADGNARTPIRSRLTTSPEVGEVIAEDLASTGDSSVTETGVPPGIRRTGRFRRLRIPVYDRFEPTHSVTPPQAYAIDIAQSDLVPRLRAHGIPVFRLRNDWTADVEVFEIDSTVTSPRVFQWHRERQYAGRWVRTSRQLAAGTWIVPVGHSLGTLAIYMLEPESDDGLATWDLVAPRPETGDRFPVLRVVAPLDSTRLNTHPLGAPSP